MTPRMSAAMARNQVGRVIPNRVGVYLERTGELGTGAIASRFLRDAIEAMIRHAREAGSLSPIAPTVLIGGSG